MVDEAFEFGEQRLLVNLSGTSYSTGTAAGSHSSGTFTGVGTAWATNIVGGNADNIGAISLNADTYTAIPFDGGGSNGPLRSWYQINGVASTTSLGIHKFSVAGDQAYKGNGITQGNYIIRPAMRILRRIGNTLVCEVTASTWSVGHSVECIICPWPDVSCFQYHFGVWTPGGTLRNFFDILNNGARTFDNAIRINSSLPASGGADALGYNTGILIDGTVDTGIIIGNAASLGIRLQGGGGNGAKIGWNVSGCSIGLDTTNQGIVIAGCENNIPSSGRLNFINSTVSVSTLSEMFFGGLVITNDCLVAPGNFTSSLPNPAIRPSGFRYEFTEDGTATQYPVYSDGSQWRPIGPRGRRSTADESVTNSVTLTGINGLQHNLQAGRTYAFKAELSYTCAAAGGVQVAISGTATATNIIYDGWIVDSAANGIKGNAQSTAMNGVVASATTTGTAGHITVKGTITVNAAGTFIVQFAQNTANGTATVIKRGAFFEIFDLI